MVIYKGDWMVVGIFRLLKYKFQILKLRHVFFNYVVVYSQANNLKKLR